MAVNPYLEEIQKSCEVLKEELVPFAFIQTGRSIQKGLEQAIRFSLDDEHKLPPIVALVGPTGAGKSTLFNAIIERVNASLVGVERPTTRAPTIACPSKHVDLVQQRFAHLKLTANVIACDEIDFVLVDAPDLNSYFKENRQAAQLLIKWSDILIFVVHRENYADYKLEQVIHSWSKKKRWFFVMSKIDQDVKSKKRSEFKNKFDQSLKDKGFKKVNDEVRFLVSAQDTDDGFESLKKAIKKERTIESRKFIQEDGFLGIVSSAFKEDAIPTFKRIAQDVRGEAEKHTKSLWSSVNKHLEEKEYSTRLKRLLQNRIWQHMPGQVGHPLSALLYLRAKFSGFLSGFYGMRIASRGVSPWNLIRFSQSLISAIKGELECRGLLRSLAQSPEIKKQLTHQAAMVEDYLTENSLNGLDIENVQLESNRGVSSTEDEELPNHVRTVLNWVERRFIPKKDVTDEEEQIANRLAKPLNEAIEETAGSVAATSTKWYHQLLNFLPVAALLHMSWIVLYGWIYKEWLEPKFYLHSLAIFIVAIIPGYLALSFSVRRNASSTNIGKLLKEEDSPWNRRTLSPSGDIERLEAVHDRILSTTANIEKLKQRAEKQRELLQYELPPGAFGIFQI